MRVHWSNKALTQLANIVSELDEYSPAAAERVGNELITASLRLDDFPQLGRMIPEGNYPEVRELFVSKYRLIYTVGDFTVEIISVVHQAQRR
ncbi:MAG: type II toxin-antitoxin system RelE/ParE family toxin [Hymenobacter sp.]